MNDETRVKSQCDDLVQRIEVLERAVNAARRYFEHCERVSLSARHVGCDSREMDVRQSLKQEARDAVFST